jgi:hypothetical protein
MDINHHVVPIRQPNRNDCWAAALAMVLRLRTGDPVREVKLRAHGVHINANGSIPSDSVPILARTLRLQLVNLQNPAQLLSTPLLQRVLRGSTAAGFGYFNYPGSDSARSVELQSTQHVLLFYRLSGQDSDPTVHIIDPYTGTRFQYPMSEINENLGAVDFFIYGL